MSRSDVCDICEVEDEELNEIDKNFWLCSQCEDDYWSANPRDKRLILFSRNCGKNLLVENPKWKFSYSIRFMEGKKHRIDFKTTDRVAKIIWALERPLFVISRSLKKLRRKH